MSRTVINVNDQLLKRAQELTGLKKKVDIIRYALEEFVQTKDIRKILELRGRLPPMAHFGKGERKQ